MSERWYIDFHVLEGHVRIQGNPGGLRELAVAIETALRLESSVDTGLGVVVWPVLPAPVLNNPAAHGPVAAMRRRIRARRATRPASLPAAVDGESR